MFYSRALCRVLAPLISNKYYFFQRVSKLYFFTPRRISTYMELGLMPNLQIAVVKLRQPNIPVSIFPNVVKVYFHRFDQPKSPFPESLQKAVIWNPKHIKHLPTTITFLKIKKCHSTDWWDDGGRIEHIPPKLQKLIDKKWKTYYLPTAFPPTLTHKYTSEQISDYGLNFEKFPQLKSVFITGKKLYSNFPITVTHIIFGSQFNGPIDRLSTQTNLKSVIFGSKFNQSIEFLPPSLKELDFGFDFQLNHLEKLSNKMKLARFSVTSQLLLNLQKISAMESVTHLGFSVSDRHYSQCWLPPNLTHVFLRMFRLSIDYECSTDFLSIFGLEVKREILHPYVYKLEKPDLYIGLLRTSNLLPLPWKKVFKKIKKRDYNYL